MHDFYIIIIYPHPFIDILIVNIYQVIDIEATFYRPTFIVKPIPIINIPIFIIKCSFAFFCPTKSRKCCIERKYANRIF